MGSVAAMVISPLALASVNAPVEPRGNCRDIAGQEIQYPDLLDAPVGSRYLKPDGRVYHLFSESSTRQMKYNKHMVFADDGRPLGLIVSRPSPGKVWLMVDSGPYTVDIEIA
jgi:hypothetical protein